MSERLVEVLVTPQLRAKIKKLKGDMTYEEYLSKLLEQKKNAN